MSADLTLLRHPNEKSAFFYAGYEIVPQIIKKAIENDTLPSRASHLRIGIEYVVYQISLQILFEVPFAFFHNAFNAHYIHSANVGSKRRSQLIRYHLFSAFVDPLSIAGVIFANAFIRISTLALGILSPKISAYGCLFAANLNLRYTQTQAFIYSLFVDNQPFHEQTFKSKKINISIPIQSYLGKSVCESLFKECYPNIAVTPDKPYGEVSYPADTLRTLFN